MKKRRRIGFDLKHPLGYIDNDGYLRVAICFVKDGKRVAGYKPAHRLIGEWKFGPLTSDQCVHHSDRDRSNNHHSNFDLISRLDHNRLSLIALRASRKARRQLVTS
jgi:hypothetical protein